MWKRKEARENTPTIKSAQIRNVGEKSGDTRNNHWENSKMKQLKDSFQKTQTMKYLNKLLHDMFCQWILWNIATICTDHFLRQNLQDTKIVKCSQKRGNSHMSFRIGSRMDVWKRLSKAVKIYIYGFEGNISFIFLKPRSWRTGPKSVENSSPAQFI